MGKGFIWIESKPPPRRGLFRTIGGIIGKVLVAATPAAVAAVCLSQGWHVLVVIAFLLCLFVVRREAKKHPPGLRNWLGAAFAMLVTQAIVFFVVFILAMMFFKDYIASLFSWLPGG